MAVDVIENRERCETVHCLFHRDFDALFRDPDLNALLPDLGARRRLPSIEADLADLGVTLPNSVPYFALGSLPALPLALGWLYAAETARLDRTLLRFRAPGLCKALGGRHLSYLLEDDARGWQGLISAINALDMSQAEESHLAKGAHQAFLRVHNLITRYLNAAF